VLTADLARPGGNLTGINEIGHRKTLEKWVCFYDLLSLGSPSGEKGMRPSRLASIEE
jgi:hypothetical protein